MHSWKAEKEEEIAKAKWEDIWITWNIESYYGAVVQWPFLHLCSYRRLGSLGLGCPAKRQWLVQHHPGSFVVQELGYSRIKSSFPVCTAVCAGFLQSVIKMCSRQTLVKSIDPSPAFNVLLALFVTVLHLDPFTQALLKIPPYCPPPHYSVIFQDHGQ